MIRHSVLDNGITIVSNEYKANAAAFGWTLAGGTAAEPKGLYGAAHAFEHVACSVMRVVRPIENMGCDFAAGTNHETISMTAKVWPAKGKDILRRLLINGLRDPALTDRDWERESRRIHMEIIEDAQNNDILMHNETEARIFGRAPRGRTVLGTHDDINALNVDKLRRFHQHVLTGPAVVVTAAGAVQHERVVDEVWKQLGHLPNHSPASMPPSHFRHGGLGLVRHDLPANRLMVQYRAPVRRAPENDAHLILQQMLCADSQSYIFNRMSFRSGLVYSIACDADAWRDGAVSRFSLTISPDNSQRAIDAFAANMQAMPDGLAERDFWRIRGRYNFAMDNMHIDPEVWVRKAANDLACFGRVRSHREIKRNFNSVSFDQVRSAAADMVAARPFVTVMGAVEKLRILEPFEEARARYRARQKAHRAG